MKEAQFYSRKENLVQCQLCPHYCKLKDGQTGICSVRRSEDNKLYSLNYGDVSSSGMDPIEKKPLYHFYPGSPILSIGTWGCNFKCPFCQNWRISQEKPVVQEYTPQRVVQTALDKNSMGIAYTYSEPVVWYEFVRETSELAAEKGLKNVLVTNGYINQKPLEELLPYIDAANVDLKSAT
ncbi:MAG: radical SAM protein, partial [Bacillota bacterium]